MKCSNARNVQQQAEVTTRGLEVEPLAAGGQWEVEGRAPNAAATFTVLFIKK